MARAMAVAWRCPPERRATDARLGRDFVLRILSRSAAVSRADAPLVDIGQDAEQATHRLTPEKHIRAD